MSRIAGSGPDAPTWSLSTTASNSSTKMSSGSALRTRRWVIVAGPVNTRGRSAVAVVGVVDVLRPPAFRTDDLPLGCRERLCASGR
jgi:hypothetical protein